MSLDKEWEQYLKQSDITNNDVKCTPLPIDNIDKYDYSELPKCDELYIFHNKGLISE